MALYAPSEEEKEKFMSRAIELSNEGDSKGYGGPYGAVIVKDGKIVSEYIDYLLWGVAVPTPGYPPLEEKRGWVQIHVGYNKAGLWSLFNSLFNMKW